MPGGNHEAGACLSQEDTWGVPAALDPLCFLRGHREGPQYSARMLTGPIVCRNTEILGLGQTQPLPQEFPECPYHPETKGLMEGTTGGVGCLS